MADLNDLNCKIYVEAEMPCDELAAHLQPVLNAAQVSRGPGGTTARTPFGDVEIQRNEEADPLRARGFPDGFLSFAYVLELYLSSAAEVDRTILVTRILEHLWSLELPAVAACDYETELPHGGGFNSRSVPWPARSVNSATASPTDRHVSGINS